MQINVPIPKWTINCPLCNKKFEILLNPVPFVDCEDCNIRINFIWYHCVCDEYPRNPIIGLVEPFERK